VEAAAVAATELIPRQRRARVVGRATVRTYPQATISGLFKSLTQEKNHGDRAHPFHHHTTVG
jgi:hypothetical protein